MHTVSPPTRRRLACLWLVQAALTAAVSLSAVPPATAQQVHPDTAWQAARQAMAQGRWQQAFDAMATLADQGHPGAARDALQLWRDGRAGAQSRVSDERLARWLRFSACGGHCSAEDAPPDGGC